MNITVLGGGAMGALFGAYLSQKNQVTIVDVNGALVEAINQNGVRVLEQDGSQRIFHPQATANTAGMPASELIVVFVKAMYSRSALETNRGLIGPDTYLMTLQNGAGHEETLLEFVDPAHVIIGTTQHNSSVAGQGVVRHGGSGYTWLGNLEGDPQRLTQVAQAFTVSGLEAGVSDQVKKLIWGKMFTNVSASVLTGILQCPLGFVAADPHAWQLCTALVREAVAVAAGEGLDFDWEEKLAEVKRVCENAPEGYTSIYADLRDGRKSEVDTISGSVIRASRRNGTPAPSHEFVVGLVHAMEAKKGKEGS